MKKIWAKRIESFWHIIFSLLMLSLNHLFDECSVRTTTPSRDGDGNHFSNISYVRLFYIALAKICRSFIRDSNYYLIIL
jgi:hypothetical protein